MRKLFKMMAVVGLALPLAASAQIANSKHDLASGSTTSVKSAVAGGTTQTCIFCHTPHKPIQQKLLWNRATAASTGTFSAVNLSSGTAIPGALAIQTPTIACLTCHDGTLAIGNVQNAGGGVAGIITMLASSDLTAGGALLGTAYAKIASAGAGGMDKNHPVSIPYAGQTYNTITSKAVANGGTGNYYAAATSGCNSVSTFCTADVVNGKEINLYGTAANLGVECGSCHEVHNRYGATTTFFLRAPVGQSVICKACHIK